MHPSGHPHHLRRAAAVVLSGGVAAALVWLPGPASATVLNEFQAEGNASSTYTGTVAGGTCALTAGSSSVSSTPQNFSSGSRTASVSLDATFTDSADSSDTVRVRSHYRGTYTVAKKHGDLTRLSLGGTGTISVTRARGSASDCTAGSSAGGFAQAQFTEHKAGWFSLTRTTAKTAASIFVLVDDDTNQVAVLDFYEGDASHETARAFLKPGTYFVEQLFGGVETGEGGIAAKPVQRASLTAQLVGTFTPTGGAAKGTSGSGRRYLAFPASISCAHHSATLRWRSAAGRVTGGSILVNGHRSASVGHPRPGGRIVLHHLGRTVDNRITARLSLSGGGHAVASRAYLPCGQ